MSDLHVFAIVVVAVLVVSGVGLWTAIRLVDEPIYVGHSGGRQRRSPGRSTASSSPYIATCEPTIAHHKYPAVQGIIAALFAFSRGLAV